MKYIEDNGAIIAYNIENTYCCPFCLKSFLSKVKCTTHYMTQCNFVKGNKIWENPALKVIRVNDDCEKAQAVKTASRLIDLAKKDFSKDNFGIINEKEKGSDLILHFLVSKDSRTLGVCIHRKKRINNEDYWWIFWYLFIIPSERKKGYGTLLVDSILNNWNKGWEDEIYLMPFSKDMVPIIKRKLKNQLEIACYFPNKGIQAVRLNKI